jgi:hypothetical protein
MEEPAKPVSFFSLLTSWFLWATFHHSKDIAVQKTLVFSRDVMPSFFLGRIPGVESSTRDKPQLYFRSGFRQL